ncbi:hypothetical protein [Lacrimispora defluvii]|nr:hypothetical protein [Lacrimispora defluvii]
MRELYHGVELLSTKIEKRVDKKETEEYDDDVDKKTTKKGG